VVRKWVIRAIGLVVVLGLSGFAGLRIQQAYKKSSAAKTPPQGGPGAGVRVVSVGLGQAQMGAVREEILLTGALKPKEQVDVNPKASGRIEQVYVYVGDQVDAGDPIAELEDSELSQQVKRAEAAQAVTRAALDQRRAELANSKAELARAEELLKQGLIPKQEYEARQTGYRVVQAQVRLAQAQVDQAQAEVTEFEIRLEQTQVYAPMAGHVAKRYLDAGALVYPSTPIVNLVNLSTMVTMANVPEREVAKLRVGNKAQVQVDAFMDRKFEGRIARIAPVLDAATRSALVEVEIPNDDAGLKAEMFARVTLDLESTRQSVLIPREALVYRGTQPGVYVLLSKRPIFRSIETGLMQGEAVEVLANLESGTAIVTQGASMLTEGDQIRIGGRAAGDGMPAGGGSAGKRGPPETPKGKGRGSGLASSN